MICHLDNYIVSCMDRLSRVNEPNIACVVCPDPDSDPMPLVLDLSGEIEAGIQGEGQGCEGE